MDSIPIVSVGLPVRNGEAFVGQAMESLLGQTLHDFEIIISDNASTDRTAEICERYAREDDRVRYVRQSVDIGGPANWNFVAREARGRYFKWASANDVCEPHFLARCVAVLDEDPSAVLCYPRTVFIDGEDRVIEKYRDDPELTAEDPAERFRYVVLAARYNNAQQGVVRLSALRKTALVRNYESGDEPLMAELALLGTWRVVEDFLLRRRFTPDTHMVQLSFEEKRKRFFSQTRGPRMVFVRRFLGYCRAAVRIDVPLRTRRRLVATLARLLAWNRSGVAEELVRGLKFLFRRRGAT